MKREFRDYYPLSYINISEPISLPQSLSHISQTQFSSCVPSNLPPNPSSHKNSESHMSYYTHEAVSSDLHTHYHFVSSPSIKRLFLI